MSLVREALALGLKVFWWQAQFLFLNRFDDFIAPLLQRHRSRLTEPRQIQPWERKQME